MNAAAATKEPKAPLLERVGVRYFQSRSAARPAPPASGDAIHLLNPEEKAALARVTRGALLRAFLAGALSATASAIAELYGNQFTTDDAAFFSSGNLIFFAILGGVTLVASIIEIGFLYWDTLRSVHELARVAGLQLFGGTPAAQRQQVAAALARAALELPNPIDNPHRINPHRESSKWRLLVASLVYKAKIGVTNFLVKMLIRRVMGRVLARSVLNTLLPFLAVPVTALWNAVVCGFVLKEARLRAMGPSAAQELVDVVFAEAPALSPAGRLAAVRAVAVVIVRTQDLHPNLLALLSCVQEKAGDTGNAELDDPGEFLRELKTLPPAEQRVALQLLTVASIVDGKLTRKERRLLTEGYAAVGKTVDFTPVDRLKGAFVAGEGVADDAVRAL